MKKLAKWMLFNSILAVAVIMMIAGNSTEVKAATKKLCFSPSNPKVAYYCQKDNNIGKSTFGDATLKIKYVGDNSSSYARDIRSSDIKNLKSSNKNIEVKAGLFGSELKINWGKVKEKNLKSCTTTISCTIKGQKLKTKFTVKRYSKKNNPIQSLKIGNTEYKSKYNGSSYIFNDEKRFKKNQKVTISAQPKKGYYIEWICGYGVNDTGAYSHAYLKSQYGKRQTEKFKITDLERFCVEVCFVKKSTHERITIKYYPKTYKGY